MKTIVTKSHRKKGRKRSAKRKKYSNATIAKLAIEQYQENLKQQFPNIVSVSDAVHDINETETHVIALYLKDNKTTGLPTKLEVNLPDGTTSFITTEIIKGNGLAKIHYSQLTTEIANAEKPEYAGSICCAVKYPDNVDFIGLITSAHIYTYGAFDDSYNGVLNPNQQKPVSVNNTTKGKWYLKVMDHSQDLAIIQLNTVEKKDTTYKSFNNKYYAVSDIDVKTAEPNISILSRNNNSRDAFILDYNVGLEIFYDNGPSYIRNVILIGNTNNRETCATVSSSGDSGSCVYHKKNGKLIGMLMGGNDKFSFVLPLEETLNSFNLTTI